MTRILNNHRLLTRRWKSMEMMQLIATFTLLLFISTTTDALTCYCSQCQTSECEGDLCTAQVAFNPNNGQVEHWWSCLPNSQVHLCNVSSFIRTTICCNTGDNCNQNLSPVLGATSGTLNRPTLTPGGTSTVPFVPILKPETDEIPSTSAPSESVSTSAPPETVDTTTEIEVTTTMDENLETTSTPTLVYPPPPTSSQGGSCFYSNSAVSDEIRLCPLTNSCYSVLRRMSDGTFVKRRGCTSGPCEEETRNRKVKRCCSSPLCNIELSVEDFFTESPPATTQQSVTTVTTTTEPSSEEFPTTTTSSTPIIPHIRPPILTPLITTTENPETNMLCYCDSCLNMLCSSTIGCSTTVTISEGGSYAVHRSCITDQQVCNGEPSGPTSTYCCFSGHCNRPSPPTVDPTDVEPPTSVLYTTPETTASDTVDNTTPSTAESTDIIVDFTTRTIPPFVHSTVLTPSQDTTTPPAAVTDESSKVNFYFTIGTVVFVIVACIIILIFVIILIVGCVKYRRTSANRTLKIAPPLNKHTSSVSCHGNKYGSSGDVISEIIGRESRQSDSPSLRTNSSSPVSTHSVTSV